MANWRFKSFQAHVIIMSNAILRQFYGAHDEGLKEAKEEVNKFMTENWHRLSTKGFTQDLAVSIEIST